MSKKSSFCLSLQTKSFSCFASAIWEFLKCPCKNVIFAFAKIKSFRPIWFVIKKKRFCFVNAKILCLYKKKVFVFWQCQPESLFVWQWGKNKSHFTYFAGFFVVVLSVQNKRVHFFCQWVKHLLTEYLAVNEDLFIMFNISYFCFF